MLKVFQKVNILGKLGLDAVPRLFNNLQDNIQAVLEPLIRDPFMDGVILKDISLINTLAGQHINHGLGRKPQGFIVVSQDRAASIYWKQSSNTTPDKTIWMFTNSPIPVNVNLRVF